MVQVKLTIERRYRNYIPTNWGHPMLDFETSPEDSKKLTQVMLRAASVMNFDLYSVDRLTVCMDLTACHTQGCPLNLEGLLTASTADLVHDVVGIITHIDRKTGKLQNKFFPRYAL